MHCRFSQLSLLVAFSIISVLMLATIERNTVWSTKLSLWTDAAKKSPFKSRTHNNLGNCYMLLGRLHDAIAEYEQALALDRSNIEVYYNLGMNYEDAGMAALAASCYDYFCKNAPSSYQRQKELSCVWSERLRRQIRKEQK